MVVNLEQRLQQQLCALQRQQFEQQIEQQLHQQEQLRRVLETGRPPLHYTDSTSSSEEEVKPTPLLSMSTPQQPAANTEGGSPSSSHSASNDMSGDAEGVWSPDIDQAFHEALQIYPPCGRRKIILSEEGKMYGRNELIARYIKIRCGKTRTRKQVSSHIQVLARKKHREVQSKLKVISPLEDAMIAHHFQQPADIKEERLSAGAEPSASTTHTHSPPATTTAAATAAAALNLFPAASSMDMKVKALAEAAAAVASASIPSTASVPNAAITSVANALPLIRGDADANFLSNPSNSTASSLQWPYAAMMPQMFNNNFYGNGIGNEENLYNFAAAAALSAQQQMAFGQNSANTASGANLASAVSGLPGFGKLLPSALLPGGSANGLDALLSPSGAAAAAQSSTTSSSAETLADRAIATAKLILCGFTAYVERPLSDGTTERVDIVRIPQVSEEPLESIHFDDIKSKFPPVLEDLFQKGPSDAFFLVKCWANIAFEMGEDQSALYAVDSFYDSPFNFDISISSKLCSFARQIVEKVEICWAVDTDTPSPPLYHYCVEKSPMCEYMVSFINELKKLETTSIMNSVLDNFTVLQVVTNKQSGETLMVIAFNFEVSPDPESSCRVYKLIP